MSHVCTIKLASIFLWHKYQVNSMYDILPFASIALESNSYKIVNYYFMVTTLLWFSGEVLNSLDTKSLKLTFVKNFWGDKFIKHLYNL